MENNSNNWIEISKINTLQKAKVTKAIPVLLEIVRTKSDSDLIFESIDAISKFENNTVSYLANNLNNKEKVDDYFLLHIIFILNKIESIESSKLLISFFEITKDSRLHLAISIILAKRLDNVFIEDDLFSLTYSELPEHLNKTNINTESWYTSKFNNKDSAFLRLDQKLRNDISWGIQKYIKSPIITEDIYTKEVFQFCKKNIKNISTKIIFPVIITSIKNNNENETNRLIDLWISFFGFQKNKKIWTHNSSLIRDNPTLSINNVLFEKTQAIQDNQKRINRIKRCGNGLFLFLFLSYFFFNILGFIDIWNFKTNKSFFVNNAFAWNFTPPELDQIVDNHHFTVEYDSLLTSYDQAKNKYFVSLNDLDLKNSHTMAAFIDSTYFSLSSRLNENNNLNKNFSLKNIEDNIQTIKSLESNIKAINNLDLRLNYLYENFKKLKDLSEKCSLFEDSYFYSKSKMLYSEDSLKLHDLKFQFELVKVVSHDSNLLRILETFPEKIINTTNSIYNGNSKSFNTINNKKDWYNLRISGYQSQIKNGIELDKLLEILKEIHALEKKIFRILNNFELLKEFYYLSKLKSHKRPKNEISFEYYDLLLKEFRTDFLYRSIELRKDIKINKNIYEKLDNLEILLGKKISSSKNKDYIELPILSLTDTILEFISSYDSLHPQIDTTNFNMTQSWQEKYKNFKLLSLYKIKHPELLYEAQSNNKSFFIFDKTTLFEYEEELSIISLLFLLGLSSMWAILFYKFRGKISIKRFIRIILLPFPLVLAFLPYWGKLNFTLKFCVFIILLFICSIFSIIPIKYIYNENINLHLWLFPILMYCAFVLLSIFFLTNVILRENPIRNLMLLHPNGKNI